MTQARNHAFAWLITIAASACGSFDEAEPISETEAPPETALSTQALGPGDDCAPPVIQIFTCYIQSDIGYGEMGAYGVFRWAGNNCCMFIQECSSGLTSHNVDTMSSPPYERARYGDFSCWNNTPDVVCWEHPPIEGYINVRRCYTRPDGSQVNFGCGCPA